MSSADEFAQPLLSPPSSGSSIMGPRILDRDGTFSQSRGRWSVSNTVTRSQAVGSTRQRRPVAASSANATALAGGVPYGVAPSLPPRRPPTPPPSFLDRLFCRSGNRGCCCKGNSQNITPRRCWDDWFRKLLFVHVMSSEILYVQIDSFHSSILLFFYLHSQIHSLTHLHVY